MTRIVSVTPTAVERDSRTFKHAASLAQLGYESVALEGLPSQMPSGELPFALVSMDLRREPPPPADTATASGAQPADGPRVAPGADPGADPVDEVKEGMRFLPVRVSEALPEWLAGPLRKLLDGILRLGIPPLLLGRYVVDNARIYRALPPAELYYLHSYAQFVPVYLRSLRHPRATYVYDAHDSYFEVYPEEPQGWRAGLTPRFFARLERFCVKRAARFTTVSEGVAGLLESRFGRRPEVVQNYPDLRLDTEAPAGIREVAGIPADAFLLVSVGNAKAGMTIEEGLRALAELPENVHLAFVGGGLEPYAARVSELGLEGRAHLLPPVHPTEVTSFIRGADAAALLYYAITPNFLNALPNRFFHAVAAGLPQLYPPLTEVSALAERFGLGIQIDPQDPRSIASATRVLIEDPGKLAAYREGAGRAREELSWRQEEEVLDRLVRSCLEDGR